MWNCGYKDDKFKFYRIKWLDDNSGCQSKRFLSIFGCQKLLSYQRRIINRESELLLDYNVVERFLIAGFIDFIIQIM